MSTLGAAMYFLDKLKKGDIIEVEFTKQNNEKRVMRCTLNFNRIPPDKRPKKTSLQEILTQVTKNKILRVFDLGKNDWRSVPFKSLVYKEKTEQQRGSE
jgi:hypothetical protein